MKQVKVLLCSDPGAAAIERAEPGQLAAGRVAGRHATRAQPQESRVRRVRPGPRQDSAAPARRNRRHRTRHQIRGQ